MFRIDTAFLRLASACLIFGVCLGFYMGLAQDFGLVPVHAHINLVGWAALALFGVVYRLYPELAGSRLAQVHFGLSAPSAVLFPIGILSRDILRKPRGSAGRRHALAGGRGGVFHRDCRSCVLAVAIGRRYGGSQVSEAQRLPGRDGDIGENPGKDGERSHAGQAIYTPATLALYDLVVLTLSNPLVWRCPTSRILQLYDRHATDNHLDVGVGTGWYLDRCRFPGLAPRIGLLDLNPNSLAAAARRIARYRPEQHQADALRPLAISATPFRSIALTYLLHCLPGDIAGKAVVFDNLAPLLAPEGVMFGATLLSAGVERSAAARALMRLYNRKGVFSNASDSAEALHAALRQRFRSVEVEIVGCAALFVARDIRSPQAA
jgi:hypothetical protein